MRNDQINIVVDWNLYWPIGTLLQLLLSYCSSRVNLWRALEAGNREAGNEGLGPVRSDFLTV